MPIGTITKRFNNAKNIRVTFDNDREKSFSCVDQKLYSILVEGATVEYETKQNGQWVNLIAARPAGQAPADPGQMPTNAPSSPVQARQAAGYDRDTIIVDQVIFKAAVDIVVSQGHEPEAAAEMAVFMWNCVRYYRHGGDSPLVMAAIKEGGQINAPTSDDV